VTPTSAVTAGSPRQMGSDGVGDRDGVMAGVPLRLRLAVADRERVSVLDGVQLGDGGSERVEVVESEAVDEGAR
jgi:hypothetical protein